MSEKSDKAAWRVWEWAANVGVCRSVVYQLLADGKITSKKLGASRLLTTTPREFLDSLPG